MLIAGLPSEAAVWRQEHRLHTDHPAELMALLIRELGRWSLGGLQVAGADANKLKQSGWVPLDLFMPEQPQVTTNRAEIARFFGARKKGG